MINIKRQEDCSGCCACVDICRRKAIELKTDFEGFWYPEINHDLCNDCSMCERTCPQLHVEELKCGEKEEPLVYAAYHKDYEIRKVSTSGGLFSALANEMYDRGGYVGGAVYTSDFSARHIVSNNREDITIIRGSKYFQSDMTELFKETEEKLQKGEKVLVCCAPCQIAGLRLFLHKEYENLITVDFICLGINSPKVFHKYLESLERQYNAKIISVQAKNKDLGWRSLAIKIRFSNGKTYLSEGQKDDFIRGYIEAHCFCRPSCYKCKYKGFPRISDITLGDFWGIQKVAKSMDDNMGTSVVLLNTQKGMTYFESIKNNINLKQVTLRDVLSENSALISSVDLPAINRDQYYQDIDKLDFNAVATKYYPLNGKLSSKIKKRLGSIKRITSQMGYFPKPYIQFISINILRKNTKAKAHKGCLIFPSRHTVLNIDKQAQIDSKGSMLIGYKKIKGSKMETRLAIEGKGVMKIEEGNIVIYYGTEIQIFDGGKLIFSGDATINQHVQIVCMDNITIGKDVIIARDVVIRDNDGGHELLTESYKKTAPINIGNKVWIGQGAMIMKGVTIGDGAVIGAGAWVVKDVKPKALVLGDPARTVQKDIEWKC